jgi:hypothetical protein
MSQDLVGYGVIKLSNEHNFLLYVAEASFYEISAKENYLL